MGIIIPEGQPVERVDYSPVFVEYRTFEGEVRPNIVVYYIFGNGRNMGLAREYHTDLDSFVRGKCERVVPIGELQSFRGERKFLDELIESELQGVYVNVVHGMSFRKLADVASEVHARQVFEKYALLREMGVGAIKDLLGLVDAPRDDFIDGLFNAGFGDSGREERDDADWWKEGGEPGYDSES